MRVGRSVSNGVRGVGRRLRGAGLRRLSMLWLVALAVTPTARAERDLTLAEAVRLSDGSESSCNLGRGLAVFADRILAGAYNGHDELDRPVGAAYLLESDGGPDRWRLVTRLQPDDLGAGDLFGVAVSLHDGRLAVGTPNHDALGGDSGAVYLYEEDAVNGSWELAVKLLRPGGSAGDNFGQSIGLDGDVLAVGSWNQFNGGVDVFERSGEDGWLHAAGLAPDFGVLSGFTVALDDERVAGAGTRGERRRVWIFERDAGGPGAWGERAEIEGSGAFAPAALDLDGDLLAVGSPSEGRVHLFRRDDGLRMWVEEAVVEPRGPASEFGRAVAVDGDLLAVGATEADAFEALGAVLLFVRAPLPQRPWVQVARVVASVRGFGAGHDDFGLHVGLAGASLVTGGSGEDGGGECTDGAVYAFSPAVVDPDLMVSGSCPGVVRFDAAGLTPSGRVLPYWSRESGSGRLGDESVCAGKLTELGDPSPLAELQADEAGALSGEWPAGEAQCGGRVQLVDLTSCAASEVVVLP